MDVNQEPGDSQEILSPSEVERLLAQVAEQESSVAVHKTDAKVERRAKDSIQPYDFRHPVFLSASELRRLRLRHEEFIRALAARLSIYLRLEFALQMSKLQTITYQRFSEAINSPTQLTLFKVEPLTGICVLEVNPRLALTIIDRLMGGPATSVAGDHDLSEIEMALLDRVVMVVLAEWCNHWSSIQELRPVLLGHETNARFIQAAAHDAVMLALSMEATIGDCREQVQIGFPYYTLEPLIRKCSQAVEANAHPPGREPNAKPHWNRLFEDVRVPVTAEWQGLELKARELAALRVGDVLELDPLCGQHVQIRLANLPRFSGRLGTQGPKWAVELTDVLKS
jgi:flagellar motor switch protein FliM